jgi:hypothetical protein
MRRIAMAGKIHIDDAGVKALVELSGLKLSAAELRKLREGKRVPLAKHTLTELGTLFHMAAAQRQLANEAATIEGSTIGEHGPIEALRVRIVCRTIGGVTCCLVASWPPYIGIECSGTF